MMGRKYRSRRETDMSIVVNIYYTGSGGNARKFAEEMERSEERRVGKECRL